MAKDWNTAVNELEHHVLAYYVANFAKEFTMVPRAWPHGELLLIIEDKINVAARPFGAKAMAASTNAARELLHLLVEKGGFSRIEGPFNSIMHKYQPVAYRNCIDEIQNTNPLIIQARSAGPEFWNTSIQSVSA